MLKYDNWAHEFQKTKGNKVLFIGRQSGKSETLAFDAVEWAVKPQNRKFDVLFLSYTERQAEEDLTKCLLYLNEKYPKYVKMGVDKPTKHKITLKWGKRILCLPAGLMGAGVRGYTIGRLYFEEAHLIPQPVFDATTPMLLTTGGDMILAGTAPLRKEFFYKAIKNEEGLFTVWNISSEKVINERPISVSWPQWRRDSALRHLEQEKKLMAKAQYASEYLAELQEEDLAFFPDALIEKCCRLKRRKPDGNYFMGVDVAAMGGHENSFEVFCKKDDSSIVHVDNRVTTMKFTTDTEKRIIDLDKMYKFYHKNSIGIDGRGVGQGVLHHLIESNIGRKIVDLDNAKLAYDKEGHTRILLKEDMYFNLLAYMERGNIKLLDDDNIKVSLKSIQKEWIIKEGQPSKLRIWGSYSHIVEGIIRAVYLASKTKNLNLFAFSYSQI